MPIVADIPTSHALWMLSSRQICLLASVSIKLSTVKDKRWAFNGINVSFS